MAQTVKLKRSSVPGKVPSTGSLVAGEIAINTSDGKLYFKRDDNTVQTIVTTDSFVTGSVNLVGNLFVSGAFKDTTSSTGTLGQILYSTATGTEWGPNVAASSTDLIIQGKNVTAGTLPKGTPVFFTGSGTSGNLVGVIPADAGDLDRMPAGGVLAEALAAGAEGGVYLYGYINGVDTSAFNSGDDVFVAVGGGYTNVKPTGSALIQKLGNVEKVSVSNGSGAIQGPSWYNDLPNVQPGRTWVGDSNWVPQAVSTASLLVNNAVSASYIPVDGTTLQFFSGSYKYFGDRTSEMEKTLDLGRPYINADFQELIIPQLTDTGRGGLHGFRYVKKYNALYGTKRTFTNGDFTFFKWDANKLSSYSYVTASGVPVGYKGSDQIVYSPTKDKLYAPIADLTYSASSTALIISEIDPVTLQNSVVFNQNLGSSWYAAGTNTIATYGDYLYTSVFNTAYTQSRIYRISLTTFSGSFITWNYPSATTYPSLHAMATDGEKLYFSTQWGPQNYVGRVDLATFALEATASLPAGGAWPVSSITDDIALVGDYLYLPQEGYGNNDILKVNKKNLTQQTRLSILKKYPADELYVANTAFQGEWLYYSACNTSGSDTTLGAYNLNTGENVLYQNPFSGGVNEMYSDDGVVYVSGFNKYPVSGSGYVGRFTPSNLTVLRKRYNTGFEVSGSVQITGSLSVSGSVTAPGSDTQIIYNNAGVLLADSGLVYSGSRVGIGTTSPTQALDVSGSIALTGNVIQQLANLDIKISGTQEGRALRFIASSAGARIQAIGSTTSNLSLSTTVASSEVTRMTILEGGNVGIGTTTPSDKLTVADSAGTSIGITTNRAPGSTASPLYTDLNFRGFVDTPMARIRSWDESSSTADGYLTFWTNDFTGSVNVFTEKMRITPTGNIGIGTITPGRRLEVRGNAGENTAIRISTSGSATEIPTLEFYRSGIANASIFYTPDGGSGQGIHLRDSRADASGIMFETAGANERMRITHTGNIGIGTTNPSQKLTVAGDALITGSLTVNGTVTAREFKTEFVSASIIYQSGSTKFGDTFDDTHEFTGSIYLTSSQFTWNGQTVIASGVTSSMSVLNAITASNTILQSSILTNQTVGGLTSGTTLASGTGLENILRTILVTYIPPTLSSLVMRSGGSNISTSARDVGNSFTVNTASFSAVADNPTGIFPISSSWTASGADIGTATYYFGNNVLSTSNVLTVGSNYTINRATTSGTVTFTVNGRRSDSGAAITGTTTSVAFQWRNYLAASSTVPVDNSTAQTVVGAAVTSALDTDRAWTATCTAANDTTGNFTYVIYPASYGNLSNIIQNGALSVLTAFTNLGDFTITNAYGASIVVRIYKSNSDKAFASGTTLAIS